MPKNNAQAASDLTKYSPIEMTDYKNKPSNNLRLLLSEEGWWSQGACRDANLELFFSDSTNLSSQAIAICNGCSVRHPCLEYALANKEDFGVWGGTTERKRRRLKREMSRRINN